MRHKLTVSLLCIFLSASAFGQLRFPDGTEQSTAAVMRNHVVVDSVGESGANAITNGTNLLSAMTAISASNTVETIVQLGSGIYNVQSSTIVMKPHVTLIGLGNNATEITGSGTVVLQSTTNSTRVFELTIVATSDNSTAVEVDGGSLDLKRMNIKHPGANSGSDNFGVEVIGGGECDMEFVNIEVEISGSSGSFTAVSVTGDDGGAQRSAASMEGCEVEAIDDSGTMTIIGIRVGNGTESAAGEPTISLSGVTVDVESGSNLSTAIVVELNSEAQITWSRLGAFNGIAMDVDGSVGAAACIFSGSAPTGSGTISYSQCSTEFGDGYKPIIDTETAASY